MKGSECHEAPWRKYLECQTKFIKEGENTEYGKKLEYGKIQKKRHDI